MDVNSSLFLYSMDGFVFSSIIIFYGWIGILLYDYILWLDVSSSLLLYSMDRCKIRLEWTSSMICQLTYNGP